MDRMELYLKTAFCCMACDGDIAQEELSVIKSLPCFDGMDLQPKLLEFIDKLKSEGNVFLKKYLDEVANASLTIDEEREMVGIAVQTIEADQEIEYNEIAFFKKIRKRLKSSDEELLSVISEKSVEVEQITPEDYLLEDISDENDLSLWTDTFTNINVRDIVSSK